MPTTCKWMLIKSTDYHRLQVAELVLRRMLAVDDGGVPVLVTVAGQFKPLDFARCYAREWLAMGGRPDERISDPAAVREAVV